MGRRQQGEKIHRRGAGYSIRICLVLREWGERMRRGRSRLSGTELGMGLEKWFGNKQGISGNLQLVYLSLWPNS